MQMISSVASRSPLTPPNSSPPQASSSQGEQCLKMTNFSIAAIMNEGSRKEAIKVEEEEEELDVEQCSDGEKDAPRPPLSPPEAPTPKKSSKKKDEKLRVMKPKCNSPELASVDCHLETKELWDKFHELGTEMIITKTGRRMFPTVRCSFTNLRPERKYWVLLDIVPCDNKRYRYAYHRSSWLVAGKADPPPPHRFYIHPDSPFSGDQLRKQVVSFEKVKLTNNEMDKNGQVILNSMHRFQPRIYLVIRPEGSTGPITDIETCRYRSYIYPETIFTAVTAYQNQLITKLKIDSNPFAKGFRDSSRLNDFEGDSYGLLPGLDPSFLLRSPLLSDAENNNLMAAAAEKARALMLMNRGPHTLGGFFTPHHQPPPGGASTNGGPGFGPHHLLGNQSLPQLYREGGPLSLFSQWSLLAASTSSSCSSSTTTTTAAGGPSSPPRVFPPSLRFAPYAIPGQKLGGASFLGGRPSSPPPSHHHSQTPSSPPISEGLPATPPTP